MKPDLSKPSKLLRANVARGISLAVPEGMPVDRKGGDYGAGLIRGAAVITRGEALGHEFWVDGVMLQQVHDAINSSPKGYKSRLAHPGLSGDGVGRVLGRVKNATIDGDIVRADIHFLRIAHESPGGDIAAYTMGLADEDPELFGTSIVFEPDYGAEELFAAEHMDEDGNFVSPDPDNEKHLRHARLAKLWACDVVDEPAANPGGMFSRGQEIAFEANALLEYAIGLTESPPLIEELGIDPTRARHFWQRFLDTHHGEVAVTIHKETVMANSATTNDALSVKVDADALRAEGARTERERFAALAQAFNDSAFVAEMFSAGKSVEQAQPLWMQRELDRLRAENAALKAKLEDEEEDEKMEGEPEDEEQMEGEEDKEEYEGEEKKDEQMGRAKPAKFNARRSAGGAEDFVTASAEYARVNKCSIVDAQRHIARTRPELYRAYVGK